MGRVRIGMVAATVAAFAAACAPRVVPPPPQPAPQPASRPAPRPAPPPPAPAVNWIDAALSPGSWAYRLEGAASTAVFGPAGQPSFVLRCEPGRQISLTRTGATASAITVRSSNALRSLSAQPSPTGATAILSASDPLLDAMAFSRGRFAVEAQGSAQLIIPAWPEPARVVEDCRS